MNNSTFIRLLRFLAFYWHSATWLKHDLTAQRSKFKALIKEMNK